MDIASELTDAERKVVAARLRREQRVRFGGTKKRAYTAAQVNAATWDRAISGDRVRPDRLVEIVTNLWPESEGDWDQVPSLGLGPGLGALIPTPTAGDERVTRRELEEALASVTARLELIERLIMEGGGRGGDTAANQDPGPEPGDQAGGLPPHVQLASRYLRGADGDPRLALAALIHDGHDATALGVEAWLAAFNLLQSLVDEDGEDDEGGAGPVVDFPGSKGPTPGGSLDDRAALEGGETGTERRRREQDEAAERGDQ